MDEMSLIFKDNNQELLFFEKHYALLLKNVKEILEIDYPLSFSVTFIKPEEAISLNKKYRGKDYIGDVISFPIDDPDQIYVQLDFREIGDIFICFDEALAKSVKFEHTIVEEMSWLFVHGMLHILGYDHETSEADEAEMFDLTDQILNLSGLKYQLKFD